MFAVSYNLGAGSIRICLNFEKIVGILVLVILIPAVAKERASVEFIFTHFNTDNGMGIHNKAYILAVGLLMSQYSVLGYDASAHMVGDIDVPFC